MAAVLTNKRQPFLDIFTARRSLKVESTRDATIGGVAAMVTLSLFAMMNAMTDTGELTLNMTEYKPLNVAIQEIIEEPPKRIDRKKIEKPEVLPKPQEVELPPLDNPSKDINISVLPPVPPKAGPTPDFREPATDGALVPLTVVQPTYPRRAAERGIEGYILVQLTVGADGAVVPGSVQVIEASHKGLFDKEAIKAAYKFKYKPLVVNGVALESKGITYKFSFTLSNQ